MKTFKVPPGAKRLIESLRNLGYDCNTAIADLVDNCLAADSTEVHIEINAQDGNTPAHIIIADDGTGMDRDHVHEAMRFGTEQQYSVNDLGKYGLGLKTASLSQCKVLTVASKPIKKDGTRSIRSIMRWDLDHVYKTNEWELLAPESSDLENWELEAIEQAVSQKHGTVVLWRAFEPSLTALDSINGNRRERFLAEVIENVEKHLRMVFHRFLQGTIQNRRRVKIKLCGNDLDPWDPFCSSEKKTQEISIIKITPSRIDPSQKYDREPVILKPYILPREDEFSSPEAWRDASGPKGWNFQQGFYFYRNNRLLQAGGWSNLRTRDEHIKLLRVSVDFPAELDSSFALNITKMKAYMPSEIRQEVKEAVSKWAVQARKNYDKRPIKTESVKKDTIENSIKTEEKPAINIGALSISLSNTPTSTIIICNGSREGTLKIAVPYRHECAAIFEKMTGHKGDLKRFCLALICLLEGLHQGKTKPSDIPIRSLRMAVRKLI